ncbi:MAG: 16S rRNA (guanine(527)-N(7))-methyltransferase RsmG [Labilithrix sp.]|nr:16S rRNA (guanine(527)-N(7))-methyltransferase RsmG [Labilithrix sp.]MCW5809896.1 16S rRNA (guanine(527)-N(7))-methyltransferase RsmG [Labilithrix sp.]
MELLAEAGVPEARRDAIARWLDLVRTWNARIDLTAAKGDRELVDLMVADALVLATKIADGARVVDVGSGAGAPGFALALLRPDLKVTLVEPLAKRVSFLRTAIGTLARTDVELVRAKADDVVKERGRAFDVAISRATLPPPEWLPVGLSLAPVVWTLLARDEPPASPNATLDDDLTYTWPLGGAGRRAVRHLLQDATSR